MADSRSYPKAQSSPMELQANHSISSQKSYTRILCKSLVFLLFLISIPLFPSQAPDFINQTILTKFWELVHLLFIGLAVCYGLFSRINVEIDFESHSNYFDDSQLSFVSRIFHVSPIFEDGSESQSESDEKNVYQTWDSQFYKGESMVSVDNYSSVIDEQSKTVPFSNSGNGTEISFEHDGNCVVQAWSLQYFHGESMVEVSQPNYAHDECGKPEKVGGYQPLGLPVRSLNSTIRNPDSSQLSNGSDSGSNLMVYSSSYPTSMEEENFGNMDTMNLEKKFDENIFLPSQVPWSSRSGGPEFRERISRFRPLSVDETQFESFKSQSFRSTTSASSQASSMSNSPNVLSPSHSSCSDSPNSRTEESGKMKEKDETYRNSPASQSLQTSKNRGAPLNAFHLRKYSTGSLFQKDMPKNAEIDLKDLRRKRREDSSASKESRQDFLNFSEKPATVIKASSRGKSVRTIRNGAYAPEAIKSGEISKNLINDKVGKGYDETKAANIGKNEMKRGLDNMSSGINLKNLDSHSEVPKPTFVKYQSREKGEVLKNVTMESEQESKNEIADFRASLDNDVVTYSANDAGHDPNEVDKKAGEFIAKFREQIRLQKVASMERSKGLRMSGKYLR